MRQGKDPSGPPNAVIALTHFGMKYNPSGTPAGDEMLALCHSGIAIDGAFAAHWHQFMALDVNGIPVAQGGSRGQGAAALTLTFSDNGTLLSVVPSYLSFVDKIPSLPSDETMQAVYATAYTSAMERLGEVLGTAPHPLPHRDPQTNEVPYEGTAFAAFVLQAMAKYAGKKIALLYSGWLGDGLPSGSITKYHICQLFRFHGGVVTMKIPGALLIENLSIGIRNLRGESLSPLAVFGIRMKIDPRKPQGKRLIHAELENGDPIDPNTIYEIVVDSSIAEDVMGFHFADVTDREYPEVSLQDLVEQEIRHTGELILYPPKNVEIVEAAEQ